jgi:hypothetical protein
MTQARNTWRMIILPCLVSGPYRDHHTAAGERSQAVISALLVNLALKHWKGRR